MNEFKTERVIKANYTIDVNNDGSTADGIDLYASVPSGAIVTRVISSENTAFTSDGSATVDLNVGSTAVIDGAAYDTGFDGVDEQQASSSAQAASGDVTMDINTAALTDGNVDFYIYYII